MLFHQVTIKLPPLVISKIKDCTTLGIALILVSVNVVFEVIVLINRLPSLRSNVVPVKTCAFSFVPIIGPLIAPPDLSNLLFVRLFTLVFKVSIYPFKTNPWFAAKVLSTSVDNRLLTISGLTCALAVIPSSLFFKVLVKSFVDKPLPFTFSTLFSKELLMFSIAVLIGDKSP